MNTILQQHLYEAIKDGKFIASRDYYTNLNRESDELDNDLPEQFQWMLQFAKDTE